MRDFHIVVDPAFFRDSTSHRGQGLPDELLLLAGVHEDQEQTCVSFSKKELLPGMDAWAHRGFLAFLPLYYIDRNIGYAVLDQERTGSMAILPMQTLISCAFAELSQRLAIQGYAETLEKLAVCDPLTGMNNRRGFYPKA